MSSTLTDTFDETGRAADDAPLVVVSADCHAGADIGGYKPYLERRWWDEFDDWAASFVNPFSDLDDARGEMNWDSSLRLRHLDDDGIAAEVIFPNTVPPFFTSHGLVAAPPTREDYERRWAGLKAHNRWLVDFCADAPGRRAGIAQVLFNVPEDAVAEIQWAKDQGLTGGVLLPALPPGGAAPPLWDPSYEPIWATCEDLDVPLNHHGGSGSPDYGWEQGIARLVYLAEFTFFSNRSIWHMVWSGVFERHPGLRYIITEQGFGEILDQLPKHDGIHAMLSGSSDNPNTAAARELVGDYIDCLPLTPSEYLRRNAWIGASFMSAADAARRHEFGVDRIMWGADYPHTEATWPESRARIADAMVSVPIDEARRMLGLNAIDVYGFDAQLLAEVADRLGPRVSDVLGAGTEADASVLEEDST